MADFYILSRADLTPIRHVAASTLPFEADGTTPRFLDAPKGQKSFYKEAVLERPPLGPDERYGAVVYEDLGQAVATIRFPVEAIPPAPVAELSAEELYDMLEAKGTLSASDRPRPKPPR